MYSSINDIKPMDTKCRCGGECVKPAQDILKDIDNIYSSCSNCKNVNLNKCVPLVDQFNVNRVGADFGRCKCGKRHLDIVMAHILKIMIEERLRSPWATLRDTCTPLITPGYPTRYVPYLPENSLVLLTNRINKNCAQRIMEEVPEVKGVLKGDLRETIGIQDSNSDPNIYRLLAGCDMRCDVVQTPYGAICIYKHQGEVHIEFPKPVSPKVTALEKVLDKHESPTVLDCTCGPGTLGITCLKAGACRVVFNDLWYPAARTTALNLEVNGFSVNISNNKKGLTASGDIFDVYCADVEDLKYMLDDKFDVCIVDVFPGVDVNKFAKAVRELCGTILII